MAEFPTGYVVRSPADRDAAAIADVVQALDVADFGEPDFSEHDLRDDWMRPRFELTRDAWVLNGPTGRVIGYAYVWEAQPNREIEGDAYVLPEYSGRGLGSQLLDLMETRAQEISAGRQLALGVFASSANLEKRSLLERRGFVATRSVLRMRRKRETSACGHNPRLLSRNATNRIIPNVVRDDSALHESKLRSLPILRRARRYRLCQMA